MSSARCPDRHHGTAAMQRDVAFTSEELAFLAEEEEIQIVPQFTEDVVQALTGDFGPFTAGVPVDVPLWVALRLKRDRQCAIVTPPWMRVGASAAQDERGRPP